MIGDVTVLNKALQSARLVLEHVNDDLFAHTGFSHNCLNALASGRHVLTNAKINPLDPLAGRFQTYSTLAGRPIDLYFREIKLRRDEKISSPYSWDEN